MTVRCFCNRTMTSYWCLIFSTRSQTLDCIVYVVNTSVGNWWLCFEHVFDWQNVTPDVFAAALFWIVENPTKTILSVTLPPSGEARSTAVRRITIWLVSISSLDHRRKRPVRILPITLTPFVERPISTVISNIKYGWKIIPRRPVHLSYQCHEFRPVLVSAVQDALVELISHDVPVSSLRSVLCSRLWIKLISNPHTTNVFWHNIAVARNTPEIYPRRTHHRSLSGNHSVVKK